jgi:hypothetical protein
VVAIADPISEFLGITTPGRARVLGAIHYLTKPPHFADLQPIFARSAGIWLVEQAVGPPMLVRGT